MGCSISNNSKSASAYNDPSNSTEAYNTPSAAKKNGMQPPLSPQEIESRSSRSEALNTYKLTRDITLNFAWISQRGYYPDGMFLNLSLCFL